MLYFKTKNLSSYNFVLNIKFLEGFMSYDTLTRKDGFNFETRHRDMKPLKLSLIDWGNLLKHKHKHYRNVKQKQIYIN